MISSNFVSFFETSFPQFLYAITAPVPCSGVLQRNQINNFSITAFNKRGKKIWKKVWKMATKNHAQTTIPMFLARPTRFINRSKSESPFSVQLIIRRLSTPYTNHLPKHTIFAVFFLRYRVTRITSICYFNIYFNVYFNKSKKTNGRRFQKFNLRHWNSKLTCSTSH